jgi:TRAP-type C4-dicarboxylate transport system substrate-binding protein
MRKLRGPLAIAFAGAFALVAGTAAAGVDGPKVNWRLGTWGKPRAFTKGLETVKEYVEKETGGKFTITIGYESFGGPKELLDLLKVGALESTTICSSYHPEKTPAYGVLDLPFLPIADADVQQVVHDAVHKNPIILNEFAGWNAMPFMSGLLPQYEFIGKGEPPKTLEGWKGLRVRAIGGIGAAMKALGAVPTSVPATEVYTSIERGTVDAVSFPSTYAHGSYKTYEIGNWFTSNMAPGTQACPLLFNIDAWKKLPKQYQKVLTDSRPVAYKNLKAAYAEADAKFIPLFKKRLEFITYTDKDMEQFRKIGAKPVWDAWVKEREAQGIPGKELLDFVLTTAKEAAKKS